MLHKGEVNVYMWVILELNPGILGRICASVCSNMFQCLYINLRIHAVLKCHKTVDLLVAQKMLKEISSMQVAL